MSLRIFAADIDAACYAVLEQLTGSGFGNVWNNTAAAWQASPSTADRKIPLTASTQQAKNFIVNTVTLGSYTGYISITLYDDATDAQLAGGSAEAYLVAGVEDPLARSSQVAGAASSSALRIAEARTWRLPSYVESGIAPQIVTLNDAEVPTLAMDFGMRLNLDTALSTVSSVADSEAVLTIANNSIDQSRRRVHFDITAGLTGGNNHTITVTATTTDGTTVVGSGRLEVVA